MTFLVHRKKIRLGEELTLEEKEESTYQQIWSNMLAEIPRMSDIKATTLISHYPSPMDLYTFANNPSTSLDAKLSILASQMDPKATRNEMSLAISVLNSFTCSESDDPIETDHRVKKPSSKKGIEIVDPGQLTISHFFS